MLVFAVVLKLCFAGAVPHLSALLEDVAVAGVVVAGGAGLAVHVGDVPGGGVQLEYGR